MIRSIRYMFLAATLVFLPCVASGQGGYGRGGVTQGRYAPSAPKLPGVELAGPLDSATARVLLGLTVVQGTTAEHLLEQMGGLATAILLLRNVRSRTQLVQVATFPLLKPYDETLFDKVARELRTRMRQIAVQTKGRLSGERTVTADGIRSHAYDVTVGNQVDEYTFVLAGKRSSVRTSPPSIFNRRSPLAAAAPNRMGPSSKEPVDSLLIATTLVSA